MLIITSSSDTKLQLTKEQLQWYFEINLIMLQKIIKIKS